MTFIKIKKGDVTLEANSYLGKTTTFDVQAFEIGMFPVTNAEYQAFVGDNGYLNDSYWTLWLKGFDWVNSAYFENKGLNQAEQPVVGVSVFEATAYCNWLSKKTGRKIMLPSEQQWKHAAQTLGNVDNGYAIKDGGVWEWCLTEYETGEYGLRGDGIYVVREMTTTTRNTRLAVCRGGMFSVSRYKNIGFRVVRL